MATKTEKKNKKLRELMKLMNQFTENNPLAINPNNPSITDKEDSTKITVVETSRTISYSHKEWSSYGELVRNS